jgi:polysaccharide biosynthesis protein PslH
VFITPVIPLHTGMGLAMRAAVQLAGLVRTFDVTVLYIPIVETANGLSRFSAAFPHVRIEVVDCRGEADPYFRMIARLRDPEEQLLHFARYGKPSLAAAVSGAVAAQVAEHIRRSGAVFVHVFRSYLAGTLDDVPGQVLRSIDMDEDDVASFLSSAAVFAASGQSLAARWASLEANAFDRLQAQKLGAFRSVTLANAEDIALLQSRHPGLPLRALPNCVAVPRLNALAPRLRSPGRNMLFVGSLRYAPNVDGLLWFIRNVLPRISGACLSIAGRAPPSSLLAHARKGRVEFMGYVEDIASAYREAALAIAPMRSGGGTRLKILEAAAHGVPVVATPLAAAGLWTAEPPWGIAAADALHFASACKRLLANPQEALRLGRLGRHAVSRHYGYERVREDWTRLFQDTEKGSQG